MLEPVTQLLLDNRIHLQQELKKNCPSHICLFHNDSFFSFCSQGSYVYVASVLLAFFVPGLKGLK